MNLIKLVILAGVLFAGKLAACENLNVKKELQRFTSSDSVGLSVLIAKKGKVLCSEALGMANLEMSVPRKPNDIFEIGSLTKQFTAAAILLLAQDNKLALSDSISQYIAGINTTQVTVTLQHLLSHTSGLVDPINEPNFLATRVQESISLVELVDTFKNDHWVYLPGERGVYSNVGYSMLAYVIEQVTQSTYQDFLAKRIFEPLGLLSTSQASFAVTKRKVTGYTYNQNTPRQHDLLNLNWAYGAADLLSNTQDLSRFTHALMQGDILTKKYTDILLSPITFNDGTESNGSFNYSLATIGQSKALRMSGSTLGYSSHSIYLPAEQMYFVVSNNSDGVNGGAWIPPATVASKLAANYLSIPLPDYLELELDASVAEKYIGNYRLDTETQITLTYQNSQFYYQRNDGPLARVIPMGNDQFYFPDTLNYFQISNTGAAKQSMDFYDFLSDQPEIAFLK
tara:strand:- start:58 stop:1422 length:1365 start_codon:yes stop_codon:yes gene_type:complete